MDKIMLAVSEKVGYVAMGFVAGVVSTIGGAAAVKAIKAKVAKKKDEKEGVVEGDFEEVNKPEE